MEWGEYFKKRVARLKPDCPLDRKYFGSLKDAWRRRDPQKLAFEIFVSHIHSQASVCLMDAILKWEAGNGRVQEMCRLEEAEFYPKREGLLQNLEETLRAFIDEVKRNG